MQPCFRIEILPRKAEVVGDGLHLHPRLPEGAVTCRPDHGPVLFDQFLRRAEVVVLVEVILAALLQPERVGGPGRVRPVAVSPDFIVGSIVLRHQPFFGVEEVGADAVNLLPEPPPEGIVGVFRNGAAIDVLHLHLPARIIS